jgi:hypothetical protein
MTIIEFIISSIIFFLIGWFLGRFLLMIRVSTNINDMLNNKQIIFNKPLPKIESAPVYTAEEHNGVMYLYDITSKAFVCQAPTLADLAIHIHKHENISLALVVYGEITMWFVEGQVSDKAINIE